MTNTLTKSKKRGGMNGKTKTSIALISMMLPGILYLIINNYIPMAGLVVAFKSFDYAKGIWGSG